MTLTLDPPAPEILDDLTRRRFISGSLGLGAIILTGCGGEDSETTRASGTDRAFPVTVDHRWGSTIVPSQPGRVAVVGLTEQDTLLALGVKPIATTEWYGEQPQAVWPWARDALGDAKPTVLSTSDGFQFERLARLKPDLIIGTNAGMKRGDYEKLSRIAPTIAHRKGSLDYFSPWDEQTELIAEAVGKQAEGQALVKSVRVRYAKVAADHPEFEGKTATFSQGGFYEGDLYVYPEGLNTQFLTDLGFSMNPKIDALDKKDGQQVQISAERVRLLEADVIVFATEEPGSVEKLLKVPTVPRLDAVAQNRAVYTDEILAGAIYFISPLSLPYVLERLTPQLEAALDGKAPRKVVDTGAE